MVTIRPPKTIVKPTALGPVANTDTKLLIYGLFQKGRVLAQDGIADGIDFFHMDALSSAVAMKVNCDLQLTLMASSLYRLLGTELGKEYTNAKSRRIFRDFIDATAVVTIDSSTITALLHRSG